MDDVLRKHVAPEYRVLVDGKAFLNTQINAAVLYFTPGQIELMRNLMQYANRRTTWVSDYYIGYYLSPTDEDWNLIQQEVADLEDTLMGNNNVIWGYKDQYIETVVDMDMPLGTSDLLGEMVPEGEVWEVTGMSASAFSSSCNRIRVGRLTPSSETMVGEKLNPSYAELAWFHMDLILKEGDRLLWRFYGMLATEDAYCWAWGSKMEVPA